MRYTPSLPPNQIQKRYAVPQRGQPRKATFGQEKFREGLTAGAYVASTATAYFEFRHAQVLGYPHFSINDFQALVSSTKRQRLFNERFRRPPVFPLDYTFEFAMPGAPDLQF